MQEAKIIIDGDGTLEELNDELRDGLRVLHCCPAKNEEGDDAIFVVIEETGVLPFIPVNKDKLTQEVIDRIARVEKEIEKIKIENEELKDMIYTE